jgi:hypothetical protein
MINLSELSRRVRFWLFLRKGLTEVPSQGNSVISDLFPIRGGKDWNTQFELLNLCKLVSGYSVGVEELVKLYCFDAEGNLLGSKKIEVGRQSRNSININHFFEEFSDAASFAVFHACPDHKFVGNSYLAERGYVGYLYKNLKVRGYVHGNLDAIALTNGDTLELLGNVAKFRRTYFVQHLLSGPAQYEFFLSNPSRSPLTVVSKIKRGLKWEKYSTSMISPRGIYSIKIEVGESETFYMKFISRLYMGRPLVFRLAGESMDVFHG